MADDIQSPAPVAPADLPVTEGQNSELDTSHHQEKTIQQKAILGTVTVAAIAAIVIWVNPLGLFRLEVSQNQAAGITASCHRAGTPTVELVLGSFGGKGVTLERRQNTGPFEALSSSPAKIHQDRNVSYGNTYQYRVVTPSGEVSNTSTVFVSLENCQ